MAGRGGRRPGAGRKPGAKSRKTLEIALAATAAGLDPVTYLLGVMRDPTVDADRRDRAAAMVLPYCHPRLAQIEARITNHFAALPREEQIDRLRQFLVWCRTAVEQGAIGRSNGSGG
jgi:hypothetical protein